MLIRMKNPGGSACRVTLPTDPYEGWCTEERGMFRPFFGDCGLPPYRLSERYLGPRQQQIGDMLKFYTYDHAEPETPQAYDPRKQHVFSSWTSGLQDKYSAFDVRGRRQPVTATLRPQNLWKMPEGKEQKSHEESCVLVPIGRIVREYENYEGVDILDYVSSRELYEGSEQANAAYARQMLEEYVRWVLADGGTEPAQGGKKRPRED